MRSLKLLSALVLALSAAAPADALAGASCGADGFLNYVGKLQRVQISNWGLVIFVLDELIPQAVLNACGKGATNRAGFAIRTTSNNETAVKLMVSAALTAVATQSEVGLAGNSKTGVSVLATRIALRKP